MSIPTNYSQLAEDYARIEQALTYLEANFQEQPDLAEVARRVGLSEYHFQRLFTRWVGISPKRFLQFLTKEYARTLLEDSDSVLTTAYAVGLSSPGRLHDLFITCEAATPGEYKQRGKGLEIRYGFHPTPFGECLLAVTRRGICFLVFVQEGDRKAALQALHARWGQAELALDLAATESLVAQIFPLFQPETPASIQLYLHGTNFQLKVWEALLHIPAGRLVTYADIAASLQMPRAVRAVSRAVADNPIAVLIPCHRVIRKMGVIGGYRWGTARKRALIGWEMAHTTS